MPKTVLCFNLSAEKSARIKAVAEKKEIEFKEVPQADFSQKIAALLGICERENLVCLSPFKEEMLIMAGLTREQMHSFIDEIKRENASVDLKAVLTPFNLTWRCDDLLEELKKEHEVMNKMKK